MPRALARALPLAVHVGYLLGVHGQLGPGPLQLGRGLQVVGVAVGHNHQLRGIAEAVPGQAVFHVAVELAVPRINEGKRLRRR